MHSACFAWGVTTSKFLFSFEHAFQTANHVNLPDPFASPRVCPMQREMRSASINSWIVVRVLASNFTLVTRPKEKTNGRTSPTACSTA